MQRKYNTCVNCNWTGYWLDPESSDFGDGAVIYQHNVEEAKKLLDAAGFSNGFDTVAPMITTTQYGSSFPQEMEVILGMAQDAGIRSTIQPLDYNTEWRNYTEPKDRGQLGKFDGVTAQLASTSSRIWLWALLNSQGSFFRGFDAEGTGSGQGDPDLDRMTTDLLREFDQDKAHSLAFDIQRREAEMAYAGMFPGGANGFRLGWPAVGNFGVYRQDRWFKKIYIDPTKPPKKG
jgi:ABC-type transport system substrate-binding protein